MDNDNNLENILVYAWNQDAVNLKDALDAEMQTRVADSIDSMVADVSASLFVATNGSDVPPVTNNTDSEG